MGKEEEEEEQGRALFETPTWAVATVVSFMVLISLLIEHSLEQFGKWLDKTKRKALLAALEKMKEEIMLFGVLSLLMGHWIGYVSKLCVKSSSMGTNFYPCAAPRARIDLATNFNDTARVLQEAKNHCPEGQESFASKESLEQLHRLIFVLGVTHVFYSSASIALAMIKIYSWRMWENQAKEMGNEVFKGAQQQAMPRNAQMRRLTTFISYHTSHPWSQHKVLVWLLCFSRQFWSSINQADYMALRLGFITTHQLPVNYDFLNYMYRNMEEEFRYILGISLPLWIYAILCILLDFHGSDTYFYLSFIPATILLVMGTKLHRVVVKLAVEIMDPIVDIHQFRLRDELFWFRRPKLLLRLIQLISFQNAFEMASFLWSLWEIKEASCFMENHNLLVIRLTFGIISQFWCSYVTFPLYVIVTQMGSRYRKTIVSEKVRESLSKWRRRVKSGHGCSSNRPVPLPAPTLTRSASMDRLATMKGPKFLGVMEMLSQRRQASRGQSETSSPPREYRDLEASAPRNDNGEPEP